MSGDEKYTYIQVDEDGNEESVAIDLEEWEAYLPTVLAVIDSGALDKHIYTIARACRRRHNVIEGLPIPPELVEAEVEEYEAEEDEEDEDEPGVHAPSKPMLIGDVPNGAMLGNHPGGSKIHSISTAAKVPAGGYFTHAGKRYRKRDVIGKYAVLSGALKYRKANVAGSMVKIIRARTSNVEVIGVSSGVLFGKKFLVPFAAVSDIFNG